MWAKEPYWYCCLAAEEGICLLRTARSTRHGRVSPGELGLEAEEPGAGSWATPLLLFARCFSASMRASWDMARVSFCWNASVGFSSPPLPKLIVTVLEQACPLGQIAGKLLEDHEHFDAFATVLLTKLTGFSPSLREIWIASAAKAGAASLDWLTCTKSDGTQIYVGAEVSCEVSEEILQQLPSRQWGLTTPGRLEHVFWDPQMIYPQKEEKHFETFKIHAVSVTKRGVWQEQQLGRGRKMWQV